MSDPVIVEIVPPPAVIEVPFGPPAVIEVPFGPPGQAGPPGPAGPQGPPGLTVPMTLAIPFDTASTIWSGVHNFNGYPSITCVDTLGRELEGDPTWVSLGSVQVTFQRPVAGTMYLS